MKTTLISITKPLVEGINTAEELISYCARVSNPSNQLNVETAPRLLNYCIGHQHWSVFEHSSFTVEIVTSRAIAAQILRHRSFCFQEYSQRYSVATSIEDIEWRKQGKTNRQVGDGAVSMTQHDLNKIEFALSNCVHLYKELVDSGIAKECARMVLPLATSTTLYMTGNVRNWIHYIQLRTKEDTQKEHRDVALGIKDIFVSQFPAISEALGWK